MRNLILDLETIPSQNPAVKAAIYARDAFRLTQGIGMIEPDSRLADPVKMAKSIADRTAAAERDLINHNAAKLAAADKAWRETAMDGWFGHVAVIGWAVDHHKVNSPETVDVGVEIPTCSGGVIAPNFTVENVTLDVSVEKARLESFFRSVGSGEFVIVGHQVRRFDILFLWQRCVVLRIDPPRWLRVAKNSSRYSEEFVNDTAEMCSTTSKGKPFGPSLNHICESLGIPTKGDIDGSKVWDKVAAGNLADVADDCRWDVRRARSVWRRIQGLAPLDLDLRVLTEVAA